MTVEVSACGGPTGGAAMGDRLPKARVDDLHVEDLPGELIVYDLARHRAHRLNQAAKLILQHCDGTTTREQIARVLERELGAIHAEAQVDLALAVLARKHLLDGVTPYRESRRLWLRRLGLAGGAALPLVATIGVPRPARAATCLATGATCSSGAQCCSGLCLFTICV